MRTVHFTLTSMPGSPLFFGKRVFEEKPCDETHQQFDQRTWKHKVHVDESGQVVIQPFALKNMLESAAKRLQMKVPSVKGTYTKLFVQGILVTEAMRLTDHSGGKLTIDDVSVNALDVPSDGKRGSGKRVCRLFPEVRQWKTTAEILVLDNRITDEVLLKHITEGGKFIGFGSMRVENGGINGRFSVS